MSGPLEGRASGAGRVYQTTGDQHITEEHHHHHGTTAPGPGAGPDSVRRPTVGRVPVALRDRTELMDRLRAAMRKEGAAEIYVLHGMGGCGKTAVAHALFEYATGHAGRIGLWVNASDRASLRTSMFAVAADRGAGDGELQAARSGLRAPADLVWHYLDHSPEPWLLVLDNADDPSILRDGSWLRTSPRGTVLVTTRRAAVRWWPGASLNHVGVLPREDAARVLIDLAPETGTIEDAVEIADRLGSLPLALTLAGGFLAQQLLDPWSMAEYGQYLAEGRAELIDQGAVLGQDSRHLVGRTWQLSLDALTGQGLPESATLLGLLARWSPDPLPLSLLTGPQIETLIPRTRVEAALRGLLDHSLSTILDDGFRYLQTHGVLLDSVAATTTPDQAAALDTTAAAILDALVPTEPTRGPVEPPLRLLAPHLLTLLQRITRAPELTETSVRNAAGVLGTVIRLATVLHRAGEYLSALELAGASAALAEPVLGPDDRTVLSARARTGRSLFRLGRFTESETILSRTLSRREHMFGPEDPDTLDSCYELEKTLAQLSRRPEAVALIRRAIEGRKRVLGPGHPLTLLARASLLETLPAAELAAELDRPVEPLPQECSRVLVADHTVTFIVEHSHAYAQWKLGRHQAADDGARKVYQEYLRRYGPDYPLTIAAQLLCACTRAGLGDRDTAIELTAEVLERRERCLGSDHPYTISTRSDLAALLKPSPNEPSS